MLNQVSENFQSVGRPLMTPDEVMRLKAPRKDSTGNILESGEMLILMSGHAPIRGTQILYFQEPFFAAAARVAAPTISERLYDESDTAELKLLPAENKKPVEPPDGRTSVENLQVNALGNPL